MAECEGCMLIIISPISALLKLKSGGSIGAVVEQGYGRLTSHNPPHSLHYPVPHLSLGISMRFGVFALRQRDPFLARVFASYQLVLRRSYPEGCWQHCSWSGLYHISLTL